MKRRLFTVFSVLSLLLFVAVVVMWVRSYRTSDLIGSWTRRIVNNRVVVEECSGVYSSRGGAAVGSAEERQTLQGYVFEYDAPPNALDRSGWIAGVPRNGSARRPTCRNRCWASNW